MRPSFRFFDFSVKVKNLLVVYFLSGLIPLAILLQPFAPNNYLTRDAVVVSGGEWYYGFLSNVGILLWSGAAFICFFSYYYLKKAKALHFRSFLLYSGFLSSFLLCDDLFLLHESVAPNYLGINEAFILAIYPLSMMVYLLCFMDEILASSYIILFSSLFFLTLSLGVDILNRFTLLEDGFKFLGIVGWFYYFFNFTVNVQLVIFKRRKKFKVKQKPSNHRMKLKKE